MDHKEGWAPKNWCFWTVVLEKTLESPLDCKEIETVNPKGNKSWIFTGKTDAEAEAEAQYFCHLMQITDSFEKDPDAEKERRQEEKGMTVDKMVGRHHQLNELEFEQTPGDGEVQGSLVCCSLWGRKESDTSEQLNNNTFLSLIISLTFSVSQTAVH